MDKRLPVLALALGVLAAGCNQTSQQSSSSSSTSSTTATTTPTTTPAATTPEPAATTPDKPAAALPGAPGTGKTHKLPSGLQYIDIVVGSGKMAESGMTVSVNYSGWLTDGTPFDNSYDRGTPIVMQIDHAAIIPGWHEGLKGMRIGGKRKLVIPPDLAYGAEGRPGIPPNATLVFDLELVDVK
jgi:peptidylprolyl isomerase